MAPFLRVRISLPNFGTPLSENLHAWLWVASSLRWKYTTSLNEKPPASFAHFHPHYALKLERIPECYIHTCEHATYGTGIVVSGVLTGPGLRKQHTNVTIYLERQYITKCLLGILHVRVSPWTALYQSTEEKLNSCRSCSFIPTIVQSSFAYDTRKLEKLVPHSMKWFPVGRSMCQLIDLSRSIIRVVLDLYPRADYMVGKIEETLRCVEYDVVDCLNLVLHTHGSVDNTLVRDLFEIQDEMICELERIEEQIMHKRRWQVWKRPDWRRIVKAIEIFRCSIASVLESGNFGHQRNASNFRFDDEIILSSKVSCSLRSLADNEIENGDFSAAQSFLLESCDLMSQESKLLPGKVEEDVSLVELLHVYARIAEKRDEHDNSETLYRDCLELRRCFADDLNGNGHRELAVTLFELAFVVKRKGSNGEAIDLFFECERLQEVDMFDDFMRSETMFALGELLESAGALTRALAYFCRCLTLRENLLGQGVHDLDIAIAYFVIARIAEKQGDLDPAEFHYRRCLEIERSVYGPGVDHIEISRSIYALAAVLERKLFWDEAKALFRESLEMRKRVFGQDADEAYISQALHAVGRVCEELGQWNEAEEQYVESLRMDKRMYNDVDDCNITQTLFGLARVKKQQGDLDESIRLFSECLAMEKRLVANQDIEESEVTITLDALAGVMREKKCFDAAERIFRESLELKKQQYDTEDHQRFADSLFGIAGVMQDKGALQESEELFRECLSMERRLVAEGKTELGALPVVLDDLAEVVHKRCELDEAAALLRESLLLKKQIHGENVDHSDVAWSLHELAFILSEQDVLDEAEVLFIECLGMKRRLNEENENENIAATCGELASVLRKKGNLVDAERLYRHTLGIRRGLCNGPSKPLADNTFALAKVLLENSRPLDEAEELLRECLEIERQLYEEEKDHADISATLHELGNVILAKGNLIEAEKVFRESFEMRQRIENEDYDSTIASCDLYKMAGKALDLGFVDDSERLFRESLMLDRAYFGENTSHSHVANSMQGLGSALLEKGDLDEAGKCFAESLTMFHELHGEKKVHRDISLSYYFNGLVEFEKNNIELAGEFFDKCVRMEQVLFKGDSLDIATTYYRQASVLLLRNELRLADRLCQDALSMTRRILFDKEDDRHISNALLVQARVALRKRQLRRARNLASESLEMRYRMDGKKRERPAIAAALHILAEVKLLQGDVQGAVNQGTESLRIYKRAYTCNKQHPRISRVEHDLQRWQAILDSTHT